MKATKIKFEDDLFQFIKDYKEAHGTSIQHFVTVACEELKLKLQAQQSIKDSSYIQ